jgi:putative membrane protein
MTQDNGPAAQAAPVHTILSSKNKEALRMSIRQSRIEISFLAILLLASTTAFAQMGGGMYQQQQQQPPPTTTNSMPANNNASSTMPSYADQSFVENILKNNQTQVEMSQMAQEKASSGDVKDFSQRMIQVHTTLNNQLKPLAQQLGIGQTQKPSKDEKKEIAQLQQLSGADFDTAYLQAMAKEQEHTLQQFKRQESTQSVLIQKIAKADEPVLTQNLQVLQQLAEIHKVTIASAE